MDGLAPGDVSWALLEPVRGREQGGRRPVLVAASRQYLRTVTELVVVVPISTVDRAWPNHVRVVGPAGLSRPSWIMTEQPRTLSRDRLQRVVGRVDPLCLAEVQQWLRDFMDL